MNWLIIITLSITIWILLQIYGTLVSIFARKRDVGARYGRGRYALVTGASSGIGLAMVRRLRAQHVPVCAVCLADGDADALEAELDAGNAGAAEEAPSMVVRTDLATEAGVRAVLQRTASLNVGLCVLCAGSGYARALEEFGRAPTQLARYLHLNVTQTLALASHFYARWCAQGARGGLVLVSSAMALLPAAHCELYCAAKAALARFALALAPAARAHRIDVLALAPGAVVGTHFFDRVPVAAPPRGTRPARPVSLLRPVLALGQRPEAVVDAVLRALGRPGATVVDTGLLGVAVRLAAQLLGPNTLAALAHTAVWGAHALFGWFDDYITLPPQQPLPEESFSENRDNDEK